MNHKPVPIRASKDSVHAFAEGVASKLAFGPGDPILPLVSRLGGRIEYKDPDTSIDRLPESIIVKSSGNFTIYIPTMTSQERDRFTIAHELGHLFLHFPLVTKANPGATMVATRWVDETDEDLKRTEWEANWFAAGFLMNAAQFKAFYSRSQSVSAVATHFGVSTAAAEVRIKTLNL